MSNIQKDDKTLYYKSLRLKSESLVVEVKEQSPYQHGEITIFHSPRKWDDRNFGIHLKDLKALDEYIEMLKQFRDDFEPELREITDTKKIITET